MASCVVPVVFPFILASTPGDGVGQECRLARPGLEGKRRL